MAELSQQERLQPSLLDRLTDDDSEHAQESRDNRVLSLRKLRESVLRDLECLLNSVNMQSTEDLDAYPEVISSVLNYGIIDMTGHTASNVKTAVIEKLIRQAVWAFEPRILKNTVKVHAVVSEGEMSHNAVAFEIEGEMWAQPVPVRLFLRTELDLESGSIKVSDYAGNA